MTEVGSGDPTANGGAKRRWESTLPTIEQRRRSRCKKGLKQQQQRHQQREREKDEDVSEMGRPHSHANTHTRTHTRTRTPTIGKRGMKKEKVKQKEVFPLLQKCLSKLTRPLLLTFSFFHIWKKFWFKSNICTGFVSRCRGHCRCRGCCLWPRRKSKWRLVQVSERGSKNVVWSHSYFKMHHSRIAIKEKKGQKFFRCKIEWSQISIEHSSNEAAAAIGGVTVNG